MRDEAIDCILFTPPFHDGFTGGHPRGLYEGLLLFDLAVLLQRSVFSGHSPRLYDASATR